MKKILGMDSTVKICDCCGKEDLRYTIAVDNNGEIKHYGMVCASYHTKKPLSTIKRELTTRRQLAVAEYEASEESAALEAAIAKCRKYPHGYDARPDATIAAHKKYTEIMSKYGFKGE